MACDHGLSRVDYRDDLRLDVPDPGARTAGEWGRHVLLGAPARTRCGLVAGWTAIGLALRPGSGTVLGWTVLRDESDELLLGAGSRIGMPARLRFAREDGEIRFNTIVAQETALARLVWRGVEPVHVRTVPGLLARAAR